MQPSDATPCRHAGAPSPAVVRKVEELLQKIVGESEILARHGLTADEYRDALPAAIEASRGAMSAGNADRREFLLDILLALRAAGLVDDVTEPAYGKDTVYRLAVGGFGDVAVIQKGCPDGVHSSVRWSVPEWARETYLWWLCDSMKYEPGEHVVKGVQRMRPRLLQPDGRTVDGVIFHNELCGTSKRLCPKQDRAVLIGARPVPPPCVYLMPGDGERVFPGVLLSLFGIGEGALPAYLGDVAFPRRGAETHTVVSARFGVGRSTSYRR